MVQALPAGLSPAFLLPQTGTAGDLENRDAISTFQTRKGLIALVLALLPVIIDVNPDERIGGCQQNHPQCEEFLVENGVIEEIAHV